MIEKNKTLCTPAQYQSMYQRSIHSQLDFWEEMAGRLTWFKKWDQVKDTSFKDEIHIRWFEGAQLNAAYNCIDRHLPQREKQTALIWEADDPKKPGRKISYGELHQQVCRLSNALKQMGVRRGDVVTLYLPLIPEAIFSMLACARIGAVHSVVFGGFSARSLSSRINDSRSKIVITADQGLRGGKSIALKETVELALQDCPQVRSVLVVQHTSAEVPWNPERDHWYHEKVSGQSSDCPAEAMNAEDPLFILYTSGSTGKPKGLLHTTGGYLTYASLTHHYVFDYQEGQVYWCTADIGWITGHSYVVYGPLANGATQVIFEGIPSYPDASRHWQIVDKHQVNIYYTAPTAIRAMMKEGDHWVTQAKRNSLRVLGSVGEPINPEAWNWYHRVVGQERCPIVDTWWQTETGGIMITPLPGASKLKAGSAVMPFFGVRPEIVNEKGQVLEGECSGHLCIADSWPGQARTIFGDHQRFRDTYFSQYPGKYFTGDGCRRDKDGYYWITGRVDDVLNVSGHRLGTAEVESALVGHDGVCEAAVVGYPHDIKGQGIYAYVTLQSGLEPSENIRKDLIQWVRKEIGPIATPDKIHFAPALPKTRSGKIMRRILRKIAEGDIQQLGDTSTLAEPSVVEELMKNRVH